ncbi:MAG: bifunctional phosphoribosylaminoimidazolecarboxamide formyltransferase/inosine monophosphate cyclohydrolase [Candidatus Omnitrophica bacterium CG11_big_fil_rev_8_21_14_0_20_63_9]|nr:MAG: bifunctional phosphoribosylaminoimidazolecarboxamide formyltransferase/inosine monophosphate cyclohydrolase [Candidatus Omnitrophica bacterium CG11_big_fil_rev_8_21_14_0_20_63_9]
MAKIARALLSCHDKMGLEAFAKGLAELGVELVASGGTAKFLTDLKLSVTTVEAFAGITEQLDGRVKTLHPKIHAGILARRDDPAHLKSVGTQGLIDLVVVNLYPFEQTIAKPGVSLADAIEQIDIGGVALLRAAAKNFAHVGVISQPAQYAPVLKALRQGHGTLDPAVARSLAVSAFQVTSAYDALITSYLEAGSSNGKTASAPHAPARAAGLPEDVSVALHKRQALRYGENPHQQGAWYMSAAGRTWGLGTLTQLQGKELSYNNLLDIDAAVRCLLDFSEPTCAIVKHNSQCGLASAGAIGDAYDLAYACDPESVFGGIVGLNRAVDAPLAERLASTFLEVIVAPSVQPEAAAVLARKTNLRVVTLDWPAAIPAGLDWRQVLGSWLVQEPDHATVSVDTLRVATKRAPTDAERIDLLFAWTAAKHLKSNSIVIATSRATVGIGQGQPSRVGSVRMAVQQAGLKAKGAVAASDGFFPFADGMEALAHAGVTAVIQPGGSIRDAEVIAAADAAKMAMLVTGLRHFRH